ncbi:melanophilin isoform x1 [Lasius niger]|uniref:Melanophilin isoform x1 n=1 Tax=Lasius niger TaxID=67767 RepID=A0A0J7JW06_LASNI|nr:melanophilin isoform x1 [Lasius niger]
MDEFVQDAEEVLPIVENAAIDIINVPSISEDIIVTKEYTDKKFEELQEKIFSQIISAKRSILYDLDKKINELKHTILLNNPAGITAPGGVEKVKADLDIILPIK